MSGLLILMDGARRRRVTDFGADTNAILDAMTVYPGDARATVVQTLVEALKTASVWSLLGVLYVHAAHDQQAALLDWKNPTGTPAAVVNSTPFTANAGFVADGGSHIDYQVAQSAVPGATQNSNHAGWYAESSVNTVIGGVIGGSQTSLERSSANVRTRLNTSILTTDTGSNWVAGGLHVVMSRNTSTNYDRYVNGAAAAAGTGTSAALTSGNYCGLRSNVTNAAAGPQLRAFHAGAVLNSTEVAAIQAALAAYMTAVGTT
jgi:hypothetical protein